MAKYYSAKEAADILNVSKNTLYAYVSRGLLHSEATPGSKRMRRYPAHDVDALALKSEIYKAPEQALGKATDWGAPILDSAITYIDEDRFFYRGIPALELAQKSSFESTLRTLWDLPPMPGWAIESHLRDEVDRWLKERSKGNNLFGLFLSLLGFLGQKDIEVFTFASEGTCRAGVGIIDGFVRLLSGRWMKTPCAEHLAATWNLPMAATGLINSALVLMADHDLNTASFTARCTASTGCTPYAAVAAAVYSFLGRRHGGNNERIAGLLDEADGKGSLYEVIESRIRRGEVLPGFGHRLYSKDPRAEFLLQRMPDTRGYIREAFGAAETLTAVEFPTADFALVVFEREFNLPPKSGMHLFLLGRLAGLIAHIMEQYAQNKPIRPRSRYVGVLPD